MPMQPIRAVHRVQVEETEHAYKVRFPYNAHLVAQIKVIPGRQFRRDLGNCWLIPKTSAKALQRFLRQASGEDALAKVQRPYEDPALVYPTCSKTEPPHWAHQLAALRYLWNRDAALLDLPMGRGGKSRIIVDYVCNKKVLRTVIVAPLSVVSVWPQQFEKYAGLPVRVFTREHRSTIAEFTNILACAWCEHTTTNRDTPYVVVVNYESFWRAPLANWLLDDANIELLVFDEVQRIKAAGSNVSKFAYQLGAQVDVRYGLSGTPFPEGLHDAYGTYRALNPRIFGTNYGKFVNTFFETEGEHNTIVGVKDPETLRQKIDTIRFHQEPENAAYAELHTDITITLPDTVRKVYRQLADSLYAKVDAGEVTAANVAVAFTRLQQLTSGYLPVEVEDDDDLQHIEIKEMHTQKRDALVELLHSVPANEPVVVFCRFRYDLAQVHRAAELVNRASLELSGRRKDTQAWQRGAAPILAVQLRSGGVGIDLTRACIGIYYSYSFANEEYEQSTARLARPGQTRTCSFYHLCVPHSIDMKIRRALAKKQRILDVFLYDRSADYE